MLFFAFAEVMDIEYIRSGDFGKGPIPGIPNDGKTALLPPENQ